MDEMDEMASWEGGLSCAAVGEGEQLSRNSGQGFGEGAETYTRRRVWSPC